MGQRVAVLLHSLPLTRGLASRLDHDCGRVTRARYDSLEAEPKSLDDDHPFDLALGTVSAGKRSRRLDQRRGDASPGIGECDDHAAARGCLDHNGAVGWRCRPGSAATVLGDPSERECHVGIVLTVSFGGRH